MQVETFWDHFDEFFAACVVIPRNCRCCSHAWIEKVPSLCENSSNCRTWKKKNYTYVDASSFKWRNSVSMKNSVCIPVPFTRIRI
jgi:hypothetical protein